jgi:hypothetical protein
MPSVFPPVSVIFDGGIPVAINHQVGLATLSFLKQFPDLCRVL